MTFTRLQISNFQSIESLDLDLKQFTVLVGPSNTGKSATLRAIRTLANNASGNSFVRDGKASAVVAVTTAEGAEVLLERGPGQSTYHVIQDGKDEPYPKSGVSVPEAVQRVLRMAVIEDESISFAFQFDRPFLLDAPSTKVAKIIGDLTAINVCLDATREANRRRLEVGSTLKVRKADVERLSEAVRAFSDLPAAQRHLERTEDLLAKAVQAQHGHARLYDLVIGLTVADNALRDAQQASRSIPDIAPVLDLEGRVKDLQGLLGWLVTAEQNIQSNREEAEKLAQARLGAEHDYVYALQEAGTCPTCSQDTTRLTTRISA